MRVARYGVDLDLDLLGMQLSSRYCLGDSCNLLRAIFNKEIGERATTKGDLSDLIITNLLTVKVGGNLGKCDNKKHFSAFSGKTKRRQQHKNSGCLLVFI